MTSNNNNINSLSGFKVWELNLTRMELVAPEDSVAQNVDSQSDNLEIGCSADHDNSIAMSTTTSILCFQ
jgi:hypothetical protein